MSRHLMKQLVGFEIKVRGPFDISKRIMAQPSSLSLSSSNRYREKMSSSHILLNPLSNDGCWDVLFMVAGGIGLTPMLQLIKYHLDYANKSPNRNFKLFLLFANETILDQSVATSNGKLKITYILTRPPPNWEELSGHINEGILCKWFIQNYVPITDMSPSSTSSGQKPLPSPPKTSTFENSEERFNDVKRYMQDLIQDPKHIKLVICGPPLIIDSIEESLKNIGFPVNDKAIFIR